MTAPMVSRSLSLHADIRRRPAELLRRWAGLVEEDTPPGEPMARLEHRMAGLLGMPAALFFPSGTMAQQAALRVHAERTGRYSFAAHPFNHLDNWEERGYSVVHGLRFQPVGDRHALLTAADLAALGEPPGAVLWELPQRDIGGLLPGWAELVEQVGQARSLGAAAHLDGGRLFEAQPYYARPHAEIAGLFDTVYVSLYKGLCGTGGAVLAGDEATIGHAGVWRRRLGGAIADAWPLALGALDGLDRLLPRMAEFREHAVAIVAALNAEGTVRVYPEPPQTPLFHVQVPAPKAAVERAGAELIAERGVQVFLRVRSAPDPSRCSYEICVGENALDFTPEEVVELHVELVRRARLHCG